MKIKNIKIRHLFGTIKTEGNFWEGRLVRPIDIYPEFRNDRDCVHNKKRIIKIFT